MSTDIIAACPETGLPIGAHPAPLPTPHFPTRWQAVIWRNWSVATPDRLARVLHAEPDHIVNAGRQMGLDHPTTSAVERRWLKRGYITIIRQNWHLLSYSQLLDLLDWRPEQLAFVLKEDDFLWNKLGRLKPNVSPVRYVPLTDHQMRETDHLRQIVTTRFPDAGKVPDVRPFDFVDEFTTPPGTPVRARTTGPFGLRIAYSHCAVYGDPLLDPELDPYPERLLAKFAACGINGVWLQAVLYTLVPWLGDIPASKHHETRIANLKSLVDKAARYGIGVYPYLNEPRGMPPAFFNDRPEWRGAYYRSTNQNALCVSNPEILDRLEGGVRTLFEQVPGLAGVFTITMSENLTHCHSKDDRAEACPRCRSRGTDDLVAVVNNTIAKGVHDAAPDAAVIVWDWSWGESWRTTAVDKLRPDVRLMCTSEAYLPTEAMGIKGLVADYSISKVGPGPFATELWRHARARELPTIAKVQLNNTWECSAVPYLPVPFLVKQHLRNVEAAGVTGLMVSWTLGGYPAGNLALIDHEPEDLAVEQFGEAAASLIIQAWQQFGDAFEHFPLHGCPCLYTGPQNYGPMNHLHLEPTDYTATMVGFPYDNLTRWRGDHFPAEIFETQFKKLSEGWGQAVERLRIVADRIPREKRANYLDLMNVAEAAYCHFRSSYLQIRFIRLRDLNDRGRFYEEAALLLDEEIALATTLRDICRRDSRIGYEASNHYYYTDTTLMEKVLNCEYLKSALAPHGLRQ